MKKRILATSIVCVVLMALVPLFAARANSNRPVSVEINGYTIYFQGQGPIMQDNRVLVPVRGVFEHMGFYVTWNDSARMARLETDDIIIIIPADTRSFVVNNEVIIPDVPQRMVNNRLLLPLRVIADAIDATSDWDANNRVARITTVEPSPSPSPSPHPSQTFEIGYVRVIAGDDTVAPFYQRINTGYTSGGELVINNTNFLAIYELDGYIPYIVYADDIRIVVSGDDKSRMSIALFSECGDEMIDSVNWNTDRSFIDFPEESGIFLMTIHVIWGSHPGSIGTRQQPDFTTYEYLIRVKVDTETANNGFVYEYD